MLPVDPRDRAAAGAAWTALVAASNETLQPVNWDDINNKQNGQLMARALVAIRENDLGEMQATAATIDAALATNPGTNTHNDRTLAMGRKLGGYLIARGLLIEAGVPAQLSLADRVVTLVNTEYGNHPRWKSIRGCARTSSNNWGGYCLGSYSSAGRLLQLIGDPRGGPILDESFLILTGWGDGSWSAFVRSSAYNASFAPYQPYPTIIQRNPGGRSAWDGVNSEDASRGSYPNAAANYTNDAWEGLLVATEVLEAAGYSARSLNDQQMARYGLFQQRKGLLHHADIASNQTHVVNSVFGVSLPTDSRWPEGRGRQWRGTGWLYGGSR